ncbi:hypothetical protein KW790_01060 [Candidatus Parcubacteria bacterium]|nr:hypothetical protein [Candidatus Parcubacteria bacterium]
MSIKFVYFGSSQFSKYVLEELEKEGLTPVLNITSAQEPLDIKKLQEAKADVFIVASFGKILPKEVIYMPPYKTLNVHPSRLPRLRGPSPIQSSIISEPEPHLTIMRMDEEMDTGPVVVTTTQFITPWPDYYSIIEEKLGHSGGQVLAQILPLWIDGKIDEVPQDNSKATYTKKIKKEDADITNDSPELALRKIMAYETWPRARKGDLIITKAHLESGELVLDKVIPPGKKEMSYKDYENGLKGKR